MYHNDNDKFQNIINNIFLPILTNRSSFAISNAFYQYLYIYIYIYMQKAFIIIFFNIKNIALCIGF
jgi:hypothetical protein